MSEILQGDCLEVMKQFPDNHFTGIVTDPPYGLHFMGKDWDKFKQKATCGYNKPGEPRKTGISETDGSYLAGTYDDRRNDEFQSFITKFGIEAMRIVKPGGHILMCGAPRRYHRQACGLEDAGWEIRDCLCWLFGSGFPKSHNHFGPEGFGTSLKPAYEPIVLATKPIEGTFKQNYEKWGLGGLNIDACRIPTNAKSFKDKRLQKVNEVYGKYKPTDYDGSKGRWPANLLLDEEAAEQLGPPSRFFYCPKTSSRERNEGLDCYLTVKYAIDKTRDLWQEESTVAAKLLLRDIYGLTDHLSIDLSGENITAQFHRDSSSIIKTKIKQIIESKTSNLSTLSPTNEFIRDVASWMASGSNRVVNVELKNAFQRLTTSGEMVSALGVSNVALKMLSLINDEGNWKEKTSTHPTVKPLALMRYLITLISPPSNALILDPFAGSGSTIIAAEQLHIKAIGIEKQADYCEIARARLKYAAEKVHNIAEQMELF